MKSITLTAPDDWHLHFRDGEILNETVAATARCFKRAIVMPNLVPPVTTAARALEYKQRILDASPNSDFIPLMTLFLTDQVGVDDIQEAHDSGIVAAKLYPAGATTNSALAVNSIDALTPVLERMSELGMLLLVHGEVTHPDVDIFDREKAFIDLHLGAIHQKFPNLKIVFEHITTRDAVEFVLTSSDKIAATITPQHLLMNRNDMLVGGIRPHNYCLPILKRSTHQQALLDAVSSGNPKFFLGSDSAPHTRNTKEAACGCAGCYSAWGAIELYAQIFDQLNALDKLEGFASFYGADFYQLPRNSQTITLVRESWQMPGLIELANGDTIVPFFAEQNLDWKLKT